MTKGIIVAFTRNPSGQIGAFFVEENDSVKTFEKMVGMDLLLETKTLIGSGEAARIVDVINAIHSMRVVREDKVLERWFSEIFEAGMRYGMSHAPLWE